MEKYWRSIDELNHGKDVKSDREADHEHKNVILDVLDSKVTEATASRRDFLKLFGFSFATAALVSSCEKPVQKAIPYLIKPEEVTPGQASYYASTFYDGSEYASVLVKVRDGRPIKIEGNKLSPVSSGGTTARIQASVLNLYDEARYQHPMNKGEKITWDKLDNAVVSKLKLGGKTVLLTSTIISPSTKALINDFIGSNPGSEWVTYDEISAYGVRAAHKAVFGKGFIPAYHFDKAKMILSFDADFLGTWLAPVEFARDYARTRSVDKAHPEMSRHIQVESTLSLTGTNADERIPVSPAESVKMIAAVYNKLASSADFPSVEAPDNHTDVSYLVDNLLKNKGESIVISGSNDPDVQILVAGINYMLGNYGATLDSSRTISLKQGDDKEIDRLRASLAAGEVSTLLMYNVNPEYSLNGELDIAKAGTSIYIGSAMNETAKISRFVAADHHYLEAWGDAEPVSGSFSLQQPCINPIFDTRSFQDSLLKWMGSEDSYYDAIKAYWKESVFPGEGEVFESWWKKTLQAGYYEGPADKDESLSASFDNLVLHVPADDLSLLLYTSVGLMDGRHSNNPWLQELPDPVSKVCWDNYLAISAADAESMELETEMLVTVNGIEAVVLIQPGQARGTMSLALGYGRTSAGKVADNIGANGYQFVESKNGVRQYHTGDVTIKKTGDTYPLAMTQTHHSMEGRPIVRETTLKEYKKDPYAGNHFHLESEAHHQTLYPEVKFDGFHWGLIIDQNKCVGCNNCVVSCTSENNIATVGKEEVKNRRILHWLRIDRYYSESPENPRVVHQPVMCQHCDNAPCENVCPVSATMHSNEGLNQVAYSRCIGTKYCINNCPYRVRRFNWFKYVDNDKFNFHLNSDLSKLVLNPDVTVRSRGVVEKCTLCVQRIQEKKMEAKLENRPLEDGEIQPACVQSCPTGAMVFGNLNDPESQVSKQKNEERNYHLLEQLHTLPSVGYLTKVRNIEPSEGSDEGSHAEDHS